MPELSLQSLLKASKNLSTENHGAARFGVITPAAAPVRLNLVLCWPSRSVVARGLKTPLWKRHPLTLTTCHPKKALLSQEPHAVTAEMCCFLSLTKSPFIEKKERGLAQIYTEGLAGRALGFLWMASLPKKLSLKKKMLPPPALLHAESHPINNSLSIPKLSTLPCHIWKMESAWGPSHFTDWETEARNLQSRVPRTQSWLTYEPQVGSTMLISLALPRDCPAIPLTACNPKEAGLAFQPQC